MTFVGKILDSPATLKAVLEFARRVPPAALAVQALVWFVAGVVNLASPHGYGTSVPLGMAAFSVVSAVVLRVLVELAIREQFG